MSSESVLELESNSPDSAEQAPSETTSVDVRLNTLKQCCSFWMRLSRLRSLVRWTSSVARVSPTKSVNLK